MSALATLECLKKRGAFSHFSIDVFDAGPLMPACSLSSTAVVSAYGIRTGVSELGDDLARSFELACDFYKNCDLLGVEPIEHLHLGRSFNDVELNKRFVHQPSLLNCKTTLTTLLSSIPSVYALERGYLITPEHFIPRWKKNFQDHPAIRWHNDLVHNFNEFSGELLTQSGMKSCYDSIVDARGAWRNKIQVSDSSLSTVQVTGHALNWQEIDLGECSFAIGFSGKNLVYRALTKEVFLGGTTAKNRWLVPDLASLHRQWETYAVFLCKDLRQKLTQSTPTFYGAPRERTRSRRPELVLPQGSSRVAQIGGLYKNGYSSAFLLAEELTDFLMGL
jgi:hypothetical protein